MAGLRTPDGAMDRWAGILKVSINPSNVGPFFNVAASLVLSPSKTLAFPSLNTVFFKGDRAEGTGNPVIEQLSESNNIAEILVSKLGPSANVWVVDASTFFGPFAVYKEFVPSVNSRGEPKNYDPVDFPASSSIATILSKSIDQVKSSISGSESSSTVSEIPTPKTAVFGFSKGGTVINQIVSELASLNAIDIVKTDPRTLEERESICPTTNYSFLRSISEFHYVDVGLNCPGAYLTDQAVIKKIARHLTIDNSSLHFAFHGTPRQWCDRNRPWIRKEKDSLLQMLRSMDGKYGGKLQVCERLYFADMQPSLQMHFEIIPSLDVKRCYD